LAVDHLKVFATPELADAWFKENDPEGVAFGIRGSGIAVTVARARKPSNWSRRTSC
jgi:hypothetical protein